jgi:hypothetical protein
MNRDLDEMWENMDGDDVCRILIQEAIDTLRAARPYNWQEKVEDTLKTLIKIYGTDRPIDGISK